MNPDTATAADLINSIIGLHELQALSWEEFLTSFSDSGKQL
jgi:hypothetical protein